MPYYKLQQHSPAGRMLTELDDRVKRAEAEVSEFLKELHADTYHRDARFIVGEIIGILYQREPTKYILRKSLKKVGELKDEKGGVYYNYFPNDTPEGKELFKSMRALPCVKESELNHIFGVISNEKKINYILSNDVFLVVVKEGSHRVSTQEINQLEEVTEIEAMELINSKEE